MNNRHTNAELSNGGEITNNDTIILAHVPNAVDVSNPANVRQFLDDFIARYAVHDVEHAYVLTRDRDFYALAGNVGAVNPGVLDSNTLRGAVIIHNHPLLPNDVRGDSFSSYDFYFANEFQVGRQYLISYDRRNSMEFTRQYDSEELIDAWHKAWKDSSRAITSRKQKAFYRANETLKILSERLEGFEFYENF
ncbi:MAG: hypothetical protein FWG68_03790 [Defluviitaleaceae bacterium]|nr:hypothetical protein [Defluviitaleaceae bacterium]